MTPEVTNQFTGERGKVPSQITGTDLRVVKPKPQRITDDKEHVVAAWIHSAEGEDDKVNVVWICDVDFSERLDRRE